MEFRPEILVVDIEQPEQKPSEWLDGGKYPRICHWCPFA